MSKYRHIYTVTLAVCLIMPSSAFAWGIKGHQIVALIAEAHLNASTREKIRAILPKNSTLAKASIWPTKLEKHCLRWMPYIMWTCREALRHMTGIAIVRNEIVSLKRLRGR